MSPARLLCAGGLLLADVVAFVVAMSAAVMLDQAAFTGVAGSRLGEATGHGASAAALAGCGLAGMIGYFSMHEHYDHRVSFWTELRDLVVASGAAFVAVAAMAFLLAMPLSRPPLIATALLFAPLVIVLRRVSRLALDRAGVWRVPVLVVGEGAWAARAEAALRSHDELGYDVVGRVAPPLLASAGAGWMRLLRQHGGEVLMLAVDTTSRPSPALIASLVRERVPYALLPELDGLPVVGARQTFLSQEAVLVSYRNNLEKPMARALKMSFDLIAALAGLLVLAPVMLLIAAVVGVDGGPIFFAHSRIGMRGRVFHCLKFRSMVVDSDAVLQRVLQSDPQAAEEWARTHKLRRDPRITWIGRLLRKTSLDELPQLLNVLRLEMSLVGPRPIVSAEVPKYAEDIAFYYETRPGITGLWQVSGRSDTTYTQRVRLDSYYVKNWTLWQDLAIIARTVPAVLSGRGAG